MIYCRAGMSRSATLCIAYFMRHHNMTREEAFQYVKERRPIIHPNKGFLKQLNEYEAKLKFRRSGIKRKFEQDDFSYASTEEIVAFEVYNFEDLAVIKPRPKPRIMKPSLVTFDSMPLEIATSYKITEVAICEDKSAKKAVKGQRSKGARPKRPLSMPVRPRTPANVLTGENTHVLSYHNPLSVCEGIEPVPMECTSSNVVGVSRQSSKKKPFSKISEPAKVAVSYQSFAWALAEPFTGSKAINFKFEVPKYVVFADMHLPVAEKFEEIAAECPNVGYQKMAITNKQRVRTLIEPVRNSPAAKLSPVILDCPGLFQKIDTLFNTKPHVPSRFTGSSQISRSSHLRASIKLPGVKLSPTANLHQKRPVPVLNLDFKMVSQRLERPLIFEKIQKDVKIFKPQYQNATQVLYCPPLGLAGAFVPTIYDKATKDTTLSFKLPWLLTVPKRSVLLKSEVSYITETYAYCLELKLETSMPHKEYPYYFPAKKIVGPLLLEKAQKGSKVQVSWLSAKSSGAKLVKEVQEMKPKIPETPKKRIFEPQINWAATRCEFDPSICLGVEARPMEDLPSKCNAKTTFQKSLKDAKYHSAPCKVTENPQILQDPVTLKVHKTPEKYNTYMISKFVTWPLYEVSQSSKQQSCQMLNFYCEPTPFKAWAKILRHTENIAPNQETKEIQGLQVASCQIFSSNDNLIELVDIPDVVGDISLIQPLLSTQKDPAKMLIWMEVFKRSVIKARPIKPFVKIAELLPIADMRKVHIFNDCTNFANIPPTVPTARALVTSYTKPEAPKKARKDLNFAIEIVDCFRADAIHVLNPLLMKIRAIAQREKAIETTEYIRNYTCTSWSATLEENVVTSWTKAPEIKYNTARATGIIYVPLRPATEVKIDVFGCVEDHSALEGPSVINWLSRIPFM